MAKPPVPMNILEFLAALPEGRTDDSLVWVKLPAGSKLEYGLPLQRTSWVRLSHVVLGELDTYVLMRGKEAVLSTFQKDIPPFVVYEVSTQERECQCDLCCLRRNR